MPRAAHRGTHRVVLESSQSPGLGTRIGSAEQTGKCCCLITLGLVSVLASYP